MGLASVRLDRSSPPASRVGGLEKVWLVSSSTLARRVGTSGSVRSVHSSPPASRGATLVSVRSVHSSTLGKPVRNFGERSQSTNDAYGRDLSSRQFRAGEQGRNFNERFAGEKVNTSGSSLAADQFAGNRAQFADQFGVGQSQFGDQFNAGQQQQNYQNQYQNQNFMANQYQNQFNNSMGQRQNWFGEQAYNQNQPLQQLGQLLGMAGGVQNPYFQQTGQFAPQNVPYMQYRQGQGNQLAGLVGGGIQAAAIPFM